MINDQDYNGNTTKFNGGMNRDSLIPPNSLLKQALQYFFSISRKTKFILHFNIKLSIFKHFMDLHYILLP